MKALKRWWCKHFHKQYRGIYIYYDRCWEVRCACGNLWYEGEP